MLWNRCKVEFFKFKGWELNLGKSLTVKVDKGNQNFI